MQPRSLSLAVAIAAVASLTACAAKVDSTDGSAAQTVSVAVDPSSTTLTTGQGTQFAAAVTGTADLLVTWNVDEAGGGTIDQSGLYTAPTTAGSYHVRAVSHAAPDVSGVATVNVIAPPPSGSVAISPKSISVTAGGTVTFTSTVSNLSSQAVTWKVQEASGCGTVSSAGVYTAPATAATCHVVVTSVADTSKSDVATVTVTAPLAITISPTTGTLDACKTLQFSATVTGGGTDRAVVWTVAEGATGGTVSSGGLYTAPSTAGTYHVVATAHASSAVVARATVAVRDHVLAIVVNPTAPSLSTGGSQQFTATVTTTCGNFTATGP